MLLYHNSCVRYLFNVNIWRSSVKDKLTLYPRDATFNASKQFAQLIFQIITNKWLYIYIYI